MKILNCISPLVVLAAVSFAHAKPLLESDFSTARKASSFFSRVNTIGASVVGFDSGFLKLEIPNGAPDYLFVRTEEGAINDDGEQTIKYTLVFENQSPPESIVSLGFWIRLGDGDFSDGYRFLLYRDPSMSQVDLRRFKNKRPGEQGDSIWLSKANEFGHFGQSGSDVEIMESGEVMKVEITVKNTPEAVKFKISMNGKEAEASDTSKDRLTSGHGVGINLDTNGSPGPVRILCHKIAVTAENK